jgi:hypothetical protein
MPDDLISTLIDIARTGASEPSRKIVTHYIYPPIPIRRFDWQAMYDGDEPPCICGHGATEQEAIDDLLSQTDD